MRTKAKRRRKRGRNERVDDNDSFVRQVSVRGSACTFQPAVSCFTSARYSRPHDLPTHVRPNNNLTLYTPYSEKGKGMNSDPNTGVERERE